MRSFATWSAPLPGGDVSTEGVLAFDQAREHRILIVPAMFDEANKLRRMTVEVMHRLHLSGIDSFLPDLPGCNDSLQALPKQTLEDWRFAVEAAAIHFRNTHVLTIRSGALLAPLDLPGWRYAPTGGRQIMRSMMRARTIAAKEAGREETIADIEVIGREKGVELAGWKLGPELFSSLSTAKTPGAETLVDIAQDVIGGAGLWLRAEPDEDPEQADALAALVAIGLDPS